MKTVNNLLILLAALVLTGCASSEEYRYYTDAQKTIANARTMAEIARFNALVEIAKQGDTSAKVAATMAITQSKTEPIQTVVPPPKLFNWLP